MKSEELTKKLLRALRPFARLNVDDWTQEQFHDYRINRRVKVAHVLRARQVYEEITGKQLSVKPLFPPPPNPATDPKAAKRERARLRRLRRREAALRAGVR